MMSSLPTRLGRRSSCGLGEVLQQVAQDVVLLRLVAQPVGVEADVLEHAVSPSRSLVAVAVFDGVQGLVDALAVAGSKRCS